MEGNPFLLYMAGALRLLVLLLILALFAKLGSDLAAGQKAQAPRLLIGAIVAIAAAQLATWLIWRWTRHLGRR
jgi:hypothetical protein